MHVSTEVDPYSGALYARNPYNTEFPDRVAFFDVDDANRTTTCDRAEFIGRNGSLQNPAALARTHLSGKAGSGLDPCAAIQVGFDLADGQEREIIFRLGLAGTPGGDDANRLVHRFRGADAARRALEAVWHFWNHTLGAVQVETPDQSLNVLTNGWLLYQTLACRMWARSGFYQSGGAFGFRDQLQDAMALVHAEPRLLRAQLLLCAGRQFREGDVQHWWHPPSGRGVRTHCSDDYLWLALATCRYVQCTGDTGVLDEPVPFLEGRPLNPEDDSYYDLPGHSVAAESLYQHCVRAIRHGLRFGEHGLPLMGSGDWNDGMNRVGIQGKGESVWLGFFLYEVLRQFGALARRHDDPAFADFCAAEGLRLRENLEAHGWDGAWYRRAYFDDGTPLGSVDNSECQIDSISQSWAVLSGAGDADRARMAMQAVDERLVRREHALIQLLDPPFDQSDLDPGYIKGYVPGRARERRPVHPWRHLGGDGVRGPGRQPARLGTHHPDQPGEPREITGSHRDLQGGALRHGGRRLRGGAPHRPRRLDLVHRLGRLDVPAHRRIPARPAPGSGPAARRALPARALGRVEDPLPLPGDGLPHRHRASARRRRWEERRDTGDGRWCRAGRPGDSAGR